MDIVKNSISIKEIENNAAEYGWKIISSSKELGYIQLVKAGDLLSFDSEDQTYVVRRYKDNVSKRCFVAKVKNVNFLRDPYQLTKPKEYVASI